MITTRKTNFARANNRRLDELQGNRILTHVKTVEGTFLYDLIKCFGGRFLLAAVVGRA